MKRERGMVHLKHKEGTKKIIKYGVILVSDRRYEEKKSGRKLTDETMPLIKKILEKYNQEFIWFELVPDDPDLILKALTNPGNQAADIIIFTGGTGIGSRDVTVETIRPILDKEIDGFGELFRYLSFQEIGTAAMLSRAIAGTYKGKIIFCLPGSPNAVRLALEQIILKEAGHLLKMLGSLI